MKDFRSKKELPTLDDKELVKELAAAMLYRSGIAIENSQGLLKDTSQLGKIKTHIARIQTLQWQRSHAKAA